MICFNQKKVCDYDQIQKIIAEVAKFVAKKSLSREANSTTFTAIYKPKVPRGLDCFKKTTKHD